MSLATNLNAGGAILIESWRISTEHEIVNAMLEEMKAEREAVTRSCGGGGCEVRMVQVKEINGRHGEGSIQFMNLQITNSSGRQQWDQWLLDDARMNSRLRSSAREDMSTRFC